VNVVHQEFFNFPLYYPDHLKMIYKEVHQFPRAYVLHLWESQMRKQGYMDLMNVESIQSNDSTFNFLVRKYLIKIYQDGRFNS
jgi:hypothetical protein